MRAKALAAVKAYSMIEQGDRICVALSGGADSVALLAFLRGEAASLGITLSACHLNHRLRGEESQRDEAFVRQLCGEWGIPLTVRSLPIGELAAGEGLSVEACGRRERYRLFDELAANRCKVATAHTRSDSMETVLFNLARGTGLRGMGGIAPVRGAVIRPLITATREEVEGYCRAEGLAFVTDSTNLTDDYARNRIRHHAIPTLYEVNPAAHLAFGRWMEVATQADDLVQSLAAQALEQLRLGEGYSVPGLLGLHPLVAQGVLTGLCGTLSHRQTELCMELCATGGALELEGGLRFRVRGERFWVEEKPPATAFHDFTQPLWKTPPQPPAGGENPLAALGKTLCWRVEKALKYEQNTKFEQGFPLVLKNSLDYDKIYGNVILRPRQAGDSLALPGRGCTKTLKNLFQEAGVPPWERLRRLVLSDGAGVLWVEGFGAAERAAPTQTTTRLLTLRVLEEGGAD